MDVRRLLASTPEPSLGNRDSTWSMPRPLGLCPTDADISVGTMIYSGLGDPAYPKERIEVLAGGGVAVLDDFRSLTLSGLPGRSHKLRAQDKGHRALLDHFVEAVRGGVALTVTAEDGLMATLCARAAWRALSEATTVALR